MCSCACSLPKSPIPIHQDTGSTGNCRERFKKKRGGETQGTGRGSGRKSSVSPERAGFYTGLRVVSLLGCDQAQSRVSGTVILDSQGAWASLLTMVGQSLRSSPSPRAAAGSLQGWGGTAHNIKGQSLSYKRTMCSSQIQNKAFPRRFPNSRAHWAGKTQPCFLLFLISHWLGL